MFKRLSIVLILVLFLVVPANGAQKRTVNSVHSASKTIDVTADTVTPTMYSHSMSFANVDTNKAVGVFYKSDKATSDTAISFEQSFRKPTTEGAADSTYLPSHIINAALSDTDWHSATIDTVKGTFGRFKIKLNGAIPAETTIQIKVIK